MIHDEYLLAFLVAEREQALLFTTSRLTLPFLHTSARGIDYTEALRIVVLGARGKTNGEDRRS